jgi:hypothetical protein
VTTSTHHRLTDEPGIRFAVATTAIVLALFAAVVAPLHASEIELLVVVVAGTASSGLSPAVVLGVGVEAWALFTGFAHNRLGDLTFTGPDLARLALFAVGTVALAELVPRQKPTSKGVAR